MDACSNRAPEASGLGVSENSQQGNSRDMMAGLAVDGCVGVDIGQRGAHLQSDADIVT